MKLRNTLIDNSAEGYNMTEVVKECLKDEGVTEVYIATGFWDLRGTELIYDELAEFLKRDGCKFRLLIGQDPYLYAKDVESYKTGSYDKQKNAWRVDLDNFEAQEKYVKVVQMLVDNIKDKDNEKFQIHLYKPDEALEDQFLHSKCYIFKGANKEEEREIGYGIIGSSNFTQKGFDGNSELNVLETESVDVITLNPKYPKDKKHLQWFNEKWEKSKSWNEEFLLIISQSKMGDKIDFNEPSEGLTIISDSNGNIDHLTPYELYIKLLNYKFGDLLDVDSTRTITSYIPKDFSPLEYQIDAVKQCFGIMRAHGGFMLADVVGLGKTIVGTLIIKHFLNFPDDEHERKVLIVSPPAIKSAWIETIREFDKDENNRMEPLIDFITTGSIANLIDETDEDADTDSGNFEQTLNYNNYGLIIIDESHKFRNKETNMYKSLDELIAQIGMNSGVYPYIGLLSATPQNNTPEDLRNQIYLFERDHTYCTLEKVDGRNLESFFAKIIKQFKMLVSEANKLSSKQYESISDERRLAEINFELQKISTKIRDCVLCDILVRRTRTDIKNFYAADIKTQNLVFPEICGPNVLKYYMDDELSQLFADTMNLISPSAYFDFDDSEYICYYRYRAIQFFADPANKKKYEGRGSINAERLAKQLAKIMQMLLVKRLESSFSAFTTSLLNLRRYTENMIRMWNNDTIFVCPDIDINAELDYKTKGEKRNRKVTFDDCVVDIRKKIDKLNKAGRNEKGENAEYRRNDFDSCYIKLLTADYELISELCERWTKNSEDPKLDEFKAKLKPVLFNPEINAPQKLVIFSEAIDTVKTLKSVCEHQGYNVLYITAANRDENEQVIRENFDANYRGKQKSDYNIIITTEVLAEGINLHRANVILNYDTPWNSTRLMQRIGRVNRIGSSQPFVHVFNFMPSAQGDSKIQLVEKAHIKLQSFHTLFGEDSKIFTQDEKVTQYALNKFVNGEESAYEKYIYELKKYRDENPERYKFICHNENGLQMAVMQESLAGDSYFVVRTPKVKGLFVHVDANCKASIVPGIDFYPAFRCDVDADSDTVPRDWEKQCKAAIRAVGQHLVRISSSKSNSKLATDAKGIVSKIDEIDNLSVESKNLLEQADNMIRKGNSDIIRIVIAIGKILFDEQGSLFNLEQTEIDKIIDEKLNFIHKEQSKTEGDPEVYMGLAK